jgi:predicted acylesterase/phospholipase RssA
MTIKHLVISGGGPLGFRYLGALEELEKKQFWKISDIQSIYGTSIGSIIGAFICLNYDWDTLNTYIIDRPWHDAFKVTAKQIFESYYNKGLFDKKLVEIIFKPLLKAKNLELTITLQELFEYSNIDLHIFTFELNQFATIELSHTTHPDLSLIQALNMSSALPGIFMPIIQEDLCYIDGGVMCNYPINQCLRDHTNTSEILGIRCSYDKNNIVHQDSSLLDYIICLTNNAMKFIKNTVQLEHIEYEVMCNMHDNPLSMDVIQESIKSSEFRKQWLQMGENDATKFLSNTFLFSS